MFPKLPAALFLLVLCSFSNFSVAQEKIYFEPKFTLGGKQSDFITCKDIVVFETTPESKFDQYSRIIPTKKYFVVCDYTAKRILVFDKTGHFIKKVPNKLDLGRLTYNEEQDRLEVVSANKMFRLTNRDNAEIREDYKNPKNLKYFRKYYIDFSDPEHFEVQKQKILAKDILNPLPYEDGKFIVNQAIVDKNYKIAEDYELKIYKDDSLIKKYFPYKKKNDSRYIFDGGTVAVTASAAGNTKWVTHPYDYSVYALTGDSLYKVYDFVLPIDRAVPGDFFTKEFQNKTEKDNYLRQNRKLIKQFNVYSLSARYLNFSMQGMSYDRQQFIFDSKAKAFYNYDKVTPDSATFFMPVCRNLNFYDGTFYAKIAADEAKRILDEHKSDSAAFPPALKTYMETATTDSNPVLINFTYRN